MAKKQTRRSISVSRTTYERLKSFCETNGISMSQFVENRVGDFLGEGAALPESGTATERPLPAAPRPAPLAPRPISSVPTTPKSSSQSGFGSSLGPSAPPPIAPRPSVTPMTSAAARYAIDPPPPIIKKAEQPTPKAPAVPKPNEIFTF
jgi:hypothetical protein